ncbi:thermonuclease [Bacillus coahuilensis p1.1.43]|uniref:Thermonuclease n=1 Tax=Bacillus coahuilensis p1.1.43 TaxID=1150625 RepID=A0A147KBL2_9BACI|nr:thermonuclease family protein [Bacillus coahuilensis]KUP08741.1 thermonuclease [Bacillus coahuilensis p1.1.43]
MRYLQLFIVYLLFSSLIGCSNVHSPSSNNIEKFGLEPVIVERVVDGDTIVVHDGRKIRLIGINTPESTNRTEEYGKEASDYTKSQLEGREVFLQRDVSDVDRYNRSLRIVWLEVPSDDMDEQEMMKKMFNAQLVIDGYAEPSTYPPDVKYSDYFRKFAREAREYEVGLWSYGLDGTTRGDLDEEEQVESQEETTSTSNSFKNCTELREVYPDGVNKDHPAYEKKHDRDKDGWACEN